MLFKILSQFIFIYYISCLGADIDLYQDFPKGTYQSESPLRKEENLELSSMAVITDETISKYEFNEAKWKDEAPGLLSRKGENTRKIIREFYSFNHSSRWPNNVIPYEVSPELGS